MGHRCKTLVPVAGTLLQPRCTTEEDSRAIIRRKHRKKHYYDRHTKPLEAIIPGETVRMKLPGQEWWSVGTCTEQLDRRSYVVKVGDSTYRRNRNQRTTHTRHRRREGATVRARQWCTQGSSICQRNHTHSCTQERVSSSRITNQELSPTFPVDQNATARRQRGRMTMYQHKTKYQNWYSNWSSC